MVEPHLKLWDVLHEAAEEIHCLLVARGETQLAAQVPNLCVLDRCRCGDDFCSTIYTEPKPQGSYGPSYRNMDFSPENGMIILDLVDDRIACIEILYRSEIRDKLLSSLP
jgi:hypothetical protein